MSLLELIGLLASLGMGLAMGFTGSGGSILAVPILVYLFKVEPVAATSYSLGIVGSIASIGAIQAHQKGELRIRSALLFASPGVLGVLLSRLLLLPNLPEAITLGNLVFPKNSVLLLSFSILMAAAAASMIRSGLKIGLATHDEATDANSPSPLNLIPIGFAVGVLSGFVGAGGGFLIVPALTLIGGMNIKRAIGTSMFVITVQSLAGFLGGLNVLGSINWFLFSVILILGLTGMRLGTQFRNQIPQSRLKLGFGIFVIVIGSAIFIREWYLLT